MGTDNLAVPQGAVFKIVREFDAAPELVWRVTTELKHLQQWWGPQGFSWLRGSLELRPGGLFHYGLRGPGGHEMWGRFTYREVQAPGSLSYIVSFSNPEARIVRAPFNEHWPLEVQCDCSFSASHAGTQLAMRCQPINARPEEEAAYAAAHDMLRAGFGGSMQVLDAYLQSLQAG